jgi:hypothetical protein
MSKAKDISEIISDADLTGTLDVTGETTLQTHLNMGDGDIIKLGNGADLQIQHSGSYSSIVDSGTGSLLIGGNNVSITNTALNENMIICVENGAVTLYHNNVAKIATASTGVTSAGTYVGTSAGSASAPNFAITSGALGANGMFVDSANTLAFSSGGAERMRIDSSGNLTVTDGHVSSGVTHTYNLFGATGTGGSLAYVTYSFVGDPNTGMFSGAADTLKFATGGAEHMRVNSLGNVGIGDTSNIAKLMVQSNFSSYTGINVKNNNSNNSGVFISFTNSSASGAGTISQNGATGVSYNTSSDYRLKENVNYTFDATTELKKLKPAKFNFIDESNTVEGFLAHEVQEVVPIAVTGTKDATKDMINVVLNADGTIFTQSISESDWEEGKLSTTDGDGNTVDPIYASDTTWVASKTVPDMQGIDQSKLVPLLVKTIQELEARITALEEA